MARIRTVKPEFWADEKLGPMDPVTRLVFLGLISMADDGGRLLDSVKVIDAFIFPYTDDSAKESVNVLDRSGRIRRGVTESGQAVIQIVNWDHQKIDKPNTKAMLPPIVEASPNGRRLVGDLSAPLSVPVPTTNDHLPTTNDRSAGAARATWLTPYCDLWAAKAGAPPVKRMAAALAPIHKEIGPDRLVAALDTYLDAGKGAMGIEVFARSWRDWDSRVGVSHLSERERKSHRTLTEFTGGPDA